MKDEARSNLFGRDIFDWLHQGRPFVKGLTMCWER